MRILGISGSLRAQSSNTELLRQAASIAPNGVEVVLYSEMGQLPYFNPDLDPSRDSEAKLPAVVARLREEIARADALLISTPEYAHGIPGVLKNLLDWLVSDPSFEGKPIGILFGSASAASYARDSLIEILKTMSARVIDEAVIGIQGSKTKVRGEGPEVGSAIKRAIDALLRASTSDKARCP